MATLTAGSTTTSMTSFPRLPRTTLRSAAFVVALALTAWSTACCAAEIALNATAVGYIRRVPSFTYKHFPMVGYLTGSQGNGIIHTDNNSYFVFDLSGVAGTITAAELRVYTSDERTDVPEGGYWSSDASEELVLHSVATNPTTLVNYSSTQYNFGTPQYNDLDAMFTDLADGAFLGSTVMTEAEAEVQPGSVPGQPGGKIWQIPLADSALTSLNATSGLWALGGTLADTTPPISTTTELVFGGSVPFSTIPGRATPIPQLVLTTTIGLAADFDVDSDVDGRDFLIWQRGYGLTGQSNNSHGDATGNGTVGGEDLAIWQGQFGSTSLSGFSASAASVPEPATAALVGSLIFFSFLSRAGTARLHPTVRRLRP
jgi:hypothetical protein